MALNIENVEEVSHNTYEVSIRSTPEDGLSQLDGVTTPISVMALDEAEAKQRALTVFIKIKHDNRWNYEHSNFNS